MIRSVQMLLLGTATVAAMAALGLGFDPASAQGSAKGPREAAAAPKAVLELFTSQGCSSCPPADALLKTYVDRPDLVALSLPIDHWDYLGWKDTLASAKFTARWHSYAKYRGDGRKYTPQMIVNGGPHVNGSSAADIDRTIESQKSKFEKVRVPTEVHTDKSQLVIDLGPAPEGSTLREANVWLASIQREAEVPVKSGENRGKTLTFYNVVREFTPIGMWNGAAMTVRIERETVSQPGADSFAVLVQAGKGGPIIGAALLSR